MPIQVGELKLYSIEELAELLDIQPVTVRKYCRLGKIKARKLAKKWYVSEDSLTEFFSQGESQPVEDKA